MSSLCLFSPLIALILLFNCDWSIFVPYNSLDLVVSLTVVIDISQCVRHVLSNLDIDALVNRECIC